ncbi:hypothetical protein [Cryptosporangium arvum]|nr:hypothetical protein [Cryptosporangium arvum]
MFTKTDETLTAVTPELLQELLVNGEGAATDDALEGGFVPICVQPPSARR